MAEGKTLAFGGFTAPTAPEGQYKIVLSKGKKTYEHLVETKYDPKGVMNANERKEHHQFTKTMYDMVENLAYMVYQVNGYLKHAKTVLAQNTKAKKQVQPMVNKLNELLKDLVITTGDNYVESAEPELRERMSDLYANVAGSTNPINGSQKQNYNLINSEFETAKERFNKIMEKEGARFYKYLNKKGLKADTLLNKKEFLSKK
ncbi:MAG: hypothetical protein JKZ03_04945 [Flavobacteriaceae bacterium]|nr:hypothetical protein [Flavobacteriaceae bacterium]